MHACVHTMDEVRRQKLTCSLIQIIVACATHTLNPIVIDTVSYAHQNWIG